MDAFRKLAAGAPGAARASSRGQDAPPDAARSTVTSPASSLRGRRAAQGARPAPHGVAERLQAVDPGPDDVAAVGPSSVDPSSARLDRLAQLGTLTASVAHEINNPAAFVLTNHGLMLEQLDELQQQLEASDFDRGKALLCVRELREMCDDNRTGVQQIAGIVSHLRNYTRAAPPKPNATVGVNDAVRSATTMMKTLIRHDIELVTSLRDVPGVVGDAGKLAQVVMNLIVNAAQALRAQIGRRDTARIDVSTSARGDVVLMTVSDNGPGVPEALRNRIFEPFFTTKASDEGTGLGLAICADIVREHGGTIACHSVVGRGTTFEVVLPRAVSIRAARAASLRPASSTLGSDEHNRR